MNSLTITLSVHLSNPNGPSLITVFLCISIENTMKIKLFILGKFFAARIQISLLSRIHPVRINVFWSKWKHSAVKPPSLVWRNSQMVPMKLEFKRQINPTGLGFYTLKFERLNSTSLAVHICLIIGDAVPGSNKKIHIFPLSPNAENLPKNVHHKCVGTNLVKHTYLWPWHCKYFIRSYWIDYYVFVFGQIFPPAPTLLYEHPQLLIGALVCWHYGEYIKLHESLLLYN